MKTRTEGTIFVPVETFTANVDGVNVTFRQNETRVREGHEILARFAHLFRPIDAHYEVEQATAAPGEKRA